LKKNIFLLEKKFFIVLFLLFCFLKYSRLNLIYSIKEEKNSMELLPLVNEKKDIQNQNEKEIPEKLILEKKEPTIYENTNILEEEDAKSILFLECPFKKDKNQTHNFIGWKHDLGSIFSKKVKLFYGVDSVKTLPCYSFQEWLNLKQLFFILINYHIPKMDLLFDCIGFFNFKKEFVDETFDRIALETVSFYRLIKNNPSLGCFYFDKKDLNYIESVNISFCNCKISGYSILELMSEINYLKNDKTDIFLRHLFEYLNNLNNENLDFFNEEKNRKDISISIEQLLTQIQENTDIDLFDKNLVLHLIRNFINNFVPKDFSIYISLDNIKLKRKPLKEINFKLSHDVEHQTIGFLLKIEQNEKNDFYLCFYEIFNNDKDDSERMKIIKKILISYLETDYSKFFNHLLINITKYKNSFNQKINLFRSTSK
jgi:hypothetical protein